MNNIDIVLTSNTVSVMGDSPTSFRTSPYYQEKLSRSGTLSLNELIAYGYEIFQSVFSTERRRQFIEKKLKLSDSETLVITVKSDESEVHNIPFEIMNAARHETGFILKKGNISIVRDIPILDKKVLPATPPIRILILISMPLETYEENPIDPLKELRTIYDALREFIELGLVEIDVEEKVNVATVRERLLKGHYHIVHFMGHGSEGGYLLIEDDERNEREKILKADELKGLFDGSNVSVFYFDACETAKASAYTPSLAQNVFSSIQSAYVIANLTTVRDDLATESAKLVYKRMFSGDSIAHVLADVRVMLTTDWWKPVVYGAAEKNPFLLQETEGKVKRRKVIYRPPRTIKNYVYRYGVVRQASGMIEGGLRYLVLHGIGGSGKSTLAIYLSEFFQAKFRHVVFMDLRKEKIATPEDLMERINREFNISGIIDGKESEKLHVISQWKLLNERIEGRWLLIVDNIETVQDEEGIIRDDFERLMSEILNTDQTFTIFTSRLKPSLSRRQPLENVLEIGEYSEGEVAFLFRDLTDEEQQFFGSNYAEIERRFGRHPLSLSRAIEERHLTLDNIFNSGDVKEILDFYRAYFENNRSHTEKLFSLKYPFSKGLLNKLFPADFISLLTQKLLILDQHNDHYRPYRVIRSYYEDEFRLSDLDSFKNELLELIFPPNPRATPRYALSSFDLLNILAILMECRKRAADERINQALLKVFAILTSQQRFYMRLPEDLLNVIEEIGNEGRETDETAALLWARLASIYREDGNYDRAIELYQKSLELDRKLGKEDSPDTAVTYDELASVWSFKGDNDRAIDFYEKALKIKKGKLGENHVEVATTYSNLVLVYEQRGEYDRAIEFGQKAAEITEKELGKDHADLGPIYNNIALVYRHKGEYAKAIALYEKAIRICERTLSKNHPDKAVAYDNLGEVYDDKGDYDRALYWYKEALAIRENSLDRNHPSMARSFNHIAGVCKDKGDYDAAIWLYEKALRIREERLGKDHPETAVSYNNLAGAYKDKHDYGEAIRLYKRALAIKELKLGKDDVSTASTYNNIALAYNKNGDSERAIEFYERALRVFEKKLGEDSVAVASTLGNLAGVYNEKGDYGRAILLYEKALRTKETKLGEDHPEVAIIHSNLAWTFDGRGYYEKAIIHSEKALGIWEKSDAHQDILSGLLCLVDALSKIEVINYSKLVIHICELLELCDFCDVTRAQFMSGIDFRPFLQQVFGRLDIRELKKGVSDRICTERIDRFLSY